MGEGEDEFQPSLEDIDRAPLEPASRSRPLDTREYERVWDRWLVVSAEKVDLLEENSKLRRESKTSDVLDALAKPYALRVFVFMCIYSVVVGILLIADGFEENGFDLEPQVMEILVGSTAVTVVGLVATVLTGIFLSRPK